NTPSCRVTVASGRLVSPAARTARSARTGCAATTAAWIGSKAPTPPWSMPARRSSSRRRPQAATVSLRVSTAGKATTMATYILLVNSTDHGAKGVKEIPDRQEASRATAKKLGIVRKNVYMTLGPYDFVQVIEAPNDEAVAKYVLSVNSKGNV